MNNASPIKVLHNRMCCCVCILCVALLGLCAIHSLLEISSDLKLVLALYGALLSLWHPMLRSIASKHFHTLFPICISSSVHKHINRTEHQNQIQRQQQRIACHRFLTASNRRMYCISHPFNLIPPATPVFRPFSFLTFSAVDSDFGILSSIFKINVW